MTIKTITSLALLASLVVVALITSLATTRSLVVAKEHYRVGSSRDNYLATLRKLDQFEAKLIQLRSELNNSKQQNKKQVNRRNKKKQALPAKATSKPQLPPQREEQRSNVTSSADSKAMQADYDYLLLSLYWPGASCLTLKPCRGLTTQYNYFTIHGLWPTNNKTQGPVDCGPKFDTRMVTPTMLNTLRKYWPDFKPDEPNFWKHEFEKHGSCAVVSEVVKNQQDYFDKTIQLTKSLPITEVWAAAGIVPSDTQAYSKERVLAVIERSKIGVRPFITCDNNKFIKEMRFCFDKKLRPFSCKKQSGSCGDEVILKVVRP